MSKIKLIDLLSLIRKNIVAFISIGFFVVLAVGLFLGLGGAAESTVTSIYDYMEDQHFHDLDVLLPYGITDDELAELSEVEGVDTAEIAPYTYADLMIGEENFHVKVSAVTQYVDLLSLRDGRLPENENEIVVEQSWAEDNNIAIGDTIVFQSDYTGNSVFLTKIAQYSDNAVDDLGEYLSEAETHSDMETLTVSSFTITGLAESPSYIVPGSVREDDVTNGQPVDVQMFVSSDAFQSGLFNVNNQVLITSDSLRGYSYCDEEYTNLCAELEDRVLECLNEIYDVKNELIQNNKSAITLRWQQEIDDSKAEISEAETAYNDAVSAMTAMGLSQADAESALSDEAEQISESKNLISDAEAEMQDFADTEIEMHGVSALTREYNSNYHIPETSDTMISNLRYSLAGTFILIGLLVCFSAITRFVSQQTKLIGTKKALGMRKGEINATFLEFTGFAAVLGCLIGSLILSPIIQAIILNTMSTTYSIGKFSMTFSVSEALLISLLELVILIAVTLFAVWQTLNHPVIALLAGPAQPEHKERFYEKLPFWKYLSLLGKTIVNNCFSDARRVLATIIGITGATALVVLSVTLYDNVGYSPEKHFSDYFHFDSVVMINSADDSSAEDVAQILEKYGASETLVYWKTTPIEFANNEMNSVRLIVPENADEFTDFVEIYDTDNNKKIDTSVGLYCSDAVSNWYGDMTEDMSLADNYGIFYEASVDGFFKSYLCSDFMVCDKSTYVEIFGTESVPNAYLVNTENVTDLNALKAELNETDGYQGMSDFYNSSKLGFNVIQSLIQVMVAIYILIALIMSVLVLLNLLNQFIMEKKKELIVLRINGYTTKEARRYIYTDTIALCIVSVILGAVIGCILGNVSIASFDGPIIHLIRRIDIIACAVGIIVSSILTFIMSKIALKQVDKMKLTDVNS